MTILNKLPKPLLIINESSLAGEILSQDHFGNLFTSLGLFKYQNESLRLVSWIDDSELTISNISKIRIRVNDQELPLVLTFGSIDPGSCAGLVGSTGLLEIVANQSSAKDLLGLEKGNPVLLSWD